MSGWQRWIGAGVIVANDQGRKSATAGSDWRRLSEGEVRLTTSDRGTEVKWAVDTSCYASMFHVIDALAESTPPYVLRFHAMGWFEEVFATSGDAIHRIETILTRGDRYFASRAFVHAGTPKDECMPNVLRESLERRDAPDDYAVECAFDENTHNYIVDRIGPKSAIGRLWGTYTSSFPCHPKSRYGDAVSAAYSKVLEDGQPHYDQVLAAMRLPDNEVHWVPYHRVIFPSVKRHGRTAVRVVSEIAKVEFSVI